MCISVCRLWAFALEGQMSTLGVIPQKLIPLFDFLVFIFIYVYMCMSLCMDGCSALWGQKKAMDIVEQEFLIAVSCLTWVLGSTEPSSLQIPASPLDLETGSLTGTWSLPT